MAGRAATKTLEREVSAEAVAALSRRHVGLVELPESVSGPLERSIKAQLRGPAIRRLTAQLTKQLQDRSRTSLKGGFHEAQPAGSAVPAAPKLTPEEESRRWKQWLKQARRTPCQQVGSVAAALDAGTGAEAGLAPPWDAAPPAGPAAPDPVHYADAQAATFAAARLPACYAAAHRALQELRFRAPGFRPRSQLDFGAGPGTALWAAQEVWPGELAECLAVEPSPGMARLGQGIQQQRQEAPHGGDGAESEAGSRTSSGQHPNVRWVHQLPGHGPLLNQAGQRGKRAKRGSAAGGPQRSYDLVTAAYVLGELGSDAERARCVAALWARTAPGGALVVLEPGTPVGYRYALAARDQVLAAAAKAGEAAHVVAPCPHSGPCPLAGTKSWCHFAQRFGRTGLQLVTKVRPGGGLARPYQDEKFSYVALRRALQPEPLPQPRVARHRAGAAQHSAYAAQSLFEEPDILPVERQQPQGAEAEAEGSGTAGLASPGTENGAAQLQQHPTNPPASSSAGRKAELEVDADVARLVAQSISGEGDDEEEDEGEREGWEEGGGWDEEEELPAEVAAELAAFQAIAERRLEGGGTIPGIREQESGRKQQGLQGPLQPGSGAVPAAGRGSGSAAARSSTEEGARHEPVLNGSAAGGPEGEQEQPQHPAKEQEQQSGLARGTALEEGVEEEEEGRGDVAEEVEELQGVAAAWARVLRPPQKRGEHVVLQLCAAPGPAATMCGVGPGPLGAEAGQSGPLGLESGPGPGPGPWPGPRGSSRWGPSERGRSSRRDSGGAGGGATGPVLLSQVVAQSDRKGRLGPAGYSLARQCRWGDLWPDAYLTRRVLPPSGD